MKLIIKIPIILPELGGVPVLQSIHLSKRNKIVIKFVRLTSTISYSNHLFLFYIKIVKRINNFYYTFIQNICLIYKLYVINILDILIESEKGVQKWNYGICNILLLWQKSYTLDGRSLVYK